MKGHAKGQKRRPKARESAQSRDNASLYPLDPETAIRAIMEAGPNPKNDKPANRQRPAGKALKN